MIWRMPQSAGFANKSSPVTTATMFPLYLPGFKPDAEISTLRTDFQVRLALRNVST